MPQVTRRQAIQLFSAMAVAGAGGAFAIHRGRCAESPASLAEFPYSAVTLRDPGMLAQRGNVTDILLGLPEEGLMRPFRAMAGQTPSGMSLGGWYEWKPDYNPHHDDAGLAPAATFGQWTSALSRLAACGGSDRSDALKNRALRLRKLLDEAISQGYFEKTRFPAYSHDKLVCGLMDAHRLSGDRKAFDTLDKVTDAAESSLPGRPVDREIQWRLGKDTSWMWDESYTCPENLYLVSAMGAGSRYRRMAEAYLDNDTFFDPLARGENALADKQAYSYVNALCSAMQAYLVGGSDLHLRAAVNGFRFLDGQSFATGGWGADEALRKPGLDDLLKTLTSSHNSFETPCGSYAHMKLTRYLLRATGDGAYGDSMERVLHNTVRGALPLQADGRSLYSADYNFAARRMYSVHRWPCCAGTLPQVVADYGINGYLRSPGAVWVVLYQASELRWQESGVGVAMEQGGSYLDDGTVQLRVTPERPVAFTLRLRVPAWAGSGVTLSVNGRAEPVAIAQGFAAVHRLWRARDAVELRIPFALRLVLLPANGGPAHPDVAALLWGPRVLFALREPGDIGPLLSAESVLLQAERVAPDRWRASTKTGTACWCHSPR